MKKESLSKNICVSAGETKNEEARRALVPRLRFPEFRGAGKWDDALMGTLLLENPDYGVNAAAVPMSEHLPRYLRITDISEDGRYSPDKQVSVDLEATDENYLHEGDIVLARTGASVGKSYQYQKEDGMLVFAGFLIRVKPDPQKLVSTYLANFLTTKQFWKWVAVVSTRSGQPGINSTEYSSLIIPLPPSLAEQQKIAECLSSLDELIATQARKAARCRTNYFAFVLSLQRARNSLPKSFGNARKTGPSQVSRLKPPQWRILVVRGSVRLSYLGRQLSLNNNVSPSA